MAKEHKLKTPEKSEGKALITFNSGIDVTKGFIRRTQAPVIKPLTLQPGSILGGEVLAIVKRELKQGKKTVQTQLLHLKAPDGTEVLLPCSTVVRSALTQNGDKLEDVVGKIFALRVLDPRESPTWKRSYFNCEIFTRDK